MRYFDLTHYLYTAIAMCFAVFAALPWVVSSTSLLPAGAALVAVVIAAILSGPFVLSLVAIGLQLRDASVFRHVRIVRYEFDHGILRRHARPVRFSIWHRPVIGAERVQWGIDMKKVRCVTQGPYFPREDRIQLWNADPVLEMNFGDGRIEPSNHQAVLIADVNLRDLTPTPGVREALIEFISKRHIKTGVDLTMGR